ncbi:MAG: hypothetical protein OXC05_00760 [Halieaceae bacterium]|nr:hypothetical protein [Halieaceae bacterium]
MLFPRLVNSVFIYVVLTYDISAAVREDPLWLFPLSQWGDGFLEILLTFLAMPVLLALTMPPFLQLLAALILILFSGRLMTWLVFIGSLVYLVSARFH